MRRTELAALSLLLLGAPAGAFAAVSVTEVMYDAPGTDTKHEWIEVLNDGASVDLSGWKVFEGGSNHKLTVFSGSGVLATGTYAVIADDPATFLADYPNFSGALFDVAFTSGLSNSGESITLRDGALVDQDSLMYDPTLGAAGDGNTLQKIGTSWQALAATPGAASGSAGYGSSNTDTQSSNQTEETTTQTEVQTVSQGVPIEPQLRAFAGDDRAVTAGAASVFTGEATGSKGEIIPNARYVWSFGNGETKEGQSVLYTFTYPGKYVVTLDVSSSGFSASDRIVVSALAADVAIVHIDPEYIDIKNNASTELDVGLWHIRSDGKNFIFPTHTVIMPKSMVRVSASAMQLLPLSPAAQLLYPNGVPATGYQEPLFSAAPEATVQTLTVSTKSTGRGEILAEPPSENLAAAAVLASDGASRGPVPYVWWFLGLGMVVFAGMGTAYYVRRHKSG